MTNMMFLFWIAPIFGAATESHVETGTARTPRAIDDSTEKAGTYTWGSFTQCGVPIKPLCKEVTFMFAYTVPERNRFGPGEKGDKSAHCEMIAVQKVEVGGKTVPKFSKVVTVTEDNADEEYTTIPGKQLADGGQDERYNERLLYLVIPGENRHDPPTFLPAPCSIQKKPPTKNGLVLQHSPDDPDPGGFFDFEKMCNRDSTVKAEEVKPQESKKPNRPPPDPGPGGDKYP